MPRRNTTLPRLLLVLILLVVLLDPPTGKHAQAGGLSPLTTTLAYPPPPINASAAALLDADTGEWLYLKHADQPRPMASTTKIMTAILAIQHGHLNDLVRISQAAATIGESSAGLVQGELVSMHDLLYGLLLPSGNDAAIAIAEHVAGSQTRFVALMNAGARALHLTHTHFLTPYGFVKSGDSFDDPLHATSARDLALLARYAMQSPLFRTIVSTKQYTIAATRHNQEHPLSNIDYFIYWYPGADGVKPGWTGGAGICLVMDARRHGRHLIGVLLNTPNLYTDSRDLMNYGFGDFTWYPSRWPSVDRVDQSVAGGTALDPYTYFPYTGHGVRAAFLTYFLRHGGLGVFGFPRTEEVDVDGDVEQFFTNQVLSYDTRGQFASALRLGLAAVPNKAWLARLPRMPDTDTLTYYPQTGHTVTLRFRSFFLAEGGVRTFGYPITEKVTIGSTLVQYFENAEFVWHATTGNDGYVGMAPLGQLRLEQLHLLPQFAPKPDIKPIVVPVRSVGPRPSATPTATPSSRPTATATATPSPLPTSTDTPLPTATAFDTSTATPTQHPTATPTHRPTATATHIATPTHRPTPTYTPTPQPTSTPSPSDTATFAPSATPTVSEFATDTPVPGL